MYERLLIAFVVMSIIGGATLLMKHRQMTLAKRASQHFSKQTSTATIVYFWSEGCPVCKMTQKRIIEGILAEYGNEQLTLTAYNTDEAPDVAKKWGVMTLPTTIVLDARGTIRQVNNGLIVSEHLRKQLDPILFGPGKSRA